MYPSAEKAKEMVCRIGGEMCRKKFVAACDGNMTIRISENEIIVTPSGVRKGDLTPDMLIRTDLDGNILEGTLKPTSEMPMHLRIYREDDSIISTAHAHPVFLCCFANMGADIDLPLSTASAAISGKIPVAPYRNPGSSGLADSVAPYVRDFRAVMLANHGPVSWGRSSIEAWHVLEEAENYAKMAVIQKYIIREFRPVSKPQIDELADTHGITINPKRMVSAPSTTSNTEPSASLAGHPVPGVTLDDDTIERIACAVVRKLRL